MSLLDDISAAAELVSSWLAERKPLLAIVLGSGLGSILEQLEQPRQLFYNELPNFASAGVTGHAGQLYSGLLFGQQVLIFQGRYHYYEGYNAWQVTAPARLAAAVGCQKLLLTNAAGGIAADMQPGDFMLVTDHLNMVGENPLRGRAELDFVDLSNLYQAGFYPQAREQLLAQGITLHAGTLAWMSGPSYETPAEISMLQLLGASAVSMSTVPEAIVAQRFGLQVVAVSYISNLAAGKSKAHLNHQDVLAGGQQAASSFAALVATLQDLWLV
jgi:purine-nucleoside phosphorylase